MDDEVAGPRQQAEDVALVGLVRRPAVVGRERGRVVPRVDDDELVGAVERLGDVVGAAAGLGARRGGGSAQQLDELRVGQAIPCTRATATTVIWRSQARRGRQAHGRRGRMSSSLRPWTSSSQAGTGRSRGAWQRCSSRAVTACGGSIRNPDHAADLRADGSEPVVCDLEPAERRGRRGGDRAAPTPSSSPPGPGPAAARERKLTVDRDGAIKLLRGRPRRRASSAT